MNTSMQPLVSIVTLNYNQTPVTCSFLESLKKLSYKNFEVLVVDNASEHDPGDALSNAFQEVQLIRNKENLGFTGGNNVGIKAANGEYLLIINNDTEVTEDLLEKLLEPFLTDATVGMVSPKIRYFYDPEIIQYAGYTHMNPFTGRNDAIGKKEVDCGQHDQSGYTTYGHGAAMMVSREVVERVGVFADIFFIYYEELDWSARVAKAGYKIYYQAGALVYHKESITVGKNSPVKTYYFTRNRILFMRRHSEKYQFFVFIMFYSLLVIPKTVLTYLLTFQLKQFRPFCQALYWNVFEHRATKLTAQA